MLNYKRILVPVDGSGWAAEAIPYAEDLASDSHAELILIYVVEPSSVMVAAYGAPMGGYAVLGPNQYELGHEYLESLKAKVDGPYRMFLREGAASEAILEAAKEFQVDAIVMSTHGRSGLSRLLMGSTTEAVIRHATVPVMSVRPRLEPHLDASPEASVRH